MKKIIYFAAVCMILWSCTEDSMPSGMAFGTPSSSKPVESDAISASVSSLSFTADGGSESVTITSNFNWETINTPSWITLSKTSGSSGTTSVTVTAAASTSTSSRTGTITLGNSSKSVSISVSQSAASVSNEISASVTSLSFSAAGESKSISVTSNFAWETISKPSWITISPSSGSSGTTSLTITADKTTSTSSRTGSISLGKSSSATVSISVSQAAASAGADKTFTVTGNGKTVTFTMKYVEHGTFMMGGDDEEAEWRDKPVHQVTLTNDYYIGESEVTQALWYAVMGMSPTLDVDFQWQSRYGLGDNYPAYYIAYTNCLDFISKLNAITNQRFRFPTEAEWEFAARGGNKSKGYKYSGSNTIDDVAWYNENSNTSAHIVKEKKANELGIYDMSGNVSEWCSDWYNYYKTTPQTNPTGGTSGSEREMRGGSCIYLAKYCRVSSRGYNQPDQYSYPIFQGLRLVLE